MNTAKPSLEQSITNLINYIFKQYHWHKIGIIQSVDFTKNTCVVEIVHKYQRQTGENSFNTESYAPLINCPIKLNYGKDGGLIYPINKGDECLVCFNDVSFDDWYVAGNITLPKNTRVHDITDGIVITGLFNSVNQNITEYNNDATKIWYKNTKINLKDKIEIANNTTSLYLILTELVNALVSLTVVDPISGMLPISPSSTTALNNVITKINGLLE